MMITQNPTDIVRAFKQAQVFAYPTEAIYGLGCDPDNQDAVMRLLQIKNRAIGKGLILIASDFSQVKKYLKPLSKSQQEFTQASDTTYLFPALESAPEWLTGDFDSLAIRITKHSLVRTLCDALDSAIVSTSANVSGKAPAKSVNEVIIQLGDKVDILLEGELGGADKPSPIRDSISGQRFRH